MPTLQVTFTPPVVATGKFGFLIGAEDKTNASGYITSDNSGYAHVGYARVDVPTTGTTIGGTTYATSNLNAVGLVAQSTRILNLFPNDELVQISIRRGRTRPDQYDDVGECTITVNNQTGSSDPDNNTGRYQRLTTQSAVISNVAALSGTITYTAVNTFTAGDIVQITNVNPVAYNIADATIATADATSFKVVNADTGTYVNGGYATKTPAAGSPV